MHTTWSYFLDWVLSSLIRLVAQVEPFCLADSHLVTVAGMGLEQPQLKCLKPAVHILFAGVLLLLGVGCFFWVGLGWERDFFSSFLMLACGWGLTLVV